jgi:hypothetical protein
MGNQKCVRVVWSDSGFAAGLDGWSPVSDLMKDWKPSNMEAVTVGMLMYEDDDVIGVALTYSESTDSVFNLQLIMRSNIKRFEVLNA